MKTQLGWIACAVMLIGCGSSSSPHIGPVWLEDAAIFVNGEGVTNTNCRNDICQHNENVDVITWNNAIYLVHRTAMSQVLGPNCSWFVYRSMDSGTTFERVAHILGPTDRDLRDPHFLTIGRELWIIGNSRLPGVELWDAGIDAMPVGWRSSDGVTFTPGGTPWDGVGSVGPDMWTPWRAKEHNGTWYLAAYHDGDSQVTLFTSTDGGSWVQGPDIFAPDSAEVADTHPEETELVFMPNGALLALVRMDGTEPEDLGDQGRLRTNVCWSMPPYSSFGCPQILDGVRLDGPLAFFWDQRLFVIAREHLQMTVPPTKRTALYEITGDFTGNGRLAIKLWGELPSASDTAYAGATAVDHHRFFVSYYAGDIVRDQPWLIGQLSATNIWRGIIDFSQVK